MRQEQVRQVREAMGVAVKIVSPTDAATLSEVNAFIAQRVDVLTAADFAALKSWNIGAALTALYEATNYEPVYEEAVRAFNESVLGQITAPVEIPPPVVQPPVVAPPVAEPPAGDFAAAVLAVLKAHGLYIENGLFGFGGIDPKSAATVQVFGNEFVGDASIQFTTGANVATKSLSGDGGLRDLNNQRVTKEAITKIDPDAQKSYTSHMETVDPSKIESQIGTDSKHQFSIKRVDPAHPHQYTQDAVFVIDEEQQEAGWKLYRSGWKLREAIDAKYGPEKFFRPVFE